MTSAARLDQRGLGSLESERFVWGEKTHGGSQGNIFNPPKEAGDMGGCSGFCWFNVFVDVFLIC